MANATTDYNLLDCDLNLLKRIYKLVLDKILESSVNWIPRYSKLNNNKSLISYLAYTLHLAPLGKT